MKKLLVATAVIALLAGCDSEDVEKAFDKTTDFSVLEAKQEANIIKNATGYVSEYIIDNCAAAGTTECDIDKANNGISSDEKLEIKIVGSMITATFKDSGDYINYKNSGDEIQMNFSSNESHYLKIDTSFTNPRVSFDGHYISGHDSYSAVSDGLDLVNSDQLENGKIKIEAKDDYSFDY
ncbi:hypothetical protein [Vibrio algicola]|uniref:Lipoprotein n=1 Tax=Vibrio algicola TaxID=2662262 RepID=A0A5Q0TC65_9VIBR|nr:hypothetical protein [Vibrio algicola]